MIALKRIRTSSAIKAKYRGSKKLNSDKRLMFAQRNFLNGTTKKIDIDTSFWKLSKTQSKKESNGKCAYCEANTQVVAHGDVEHFRPKSIYWWLAYTYDNYLYSCQICNQIHKSDNFPIGAIQYPEPDIKKNTSDQEIEALAGKISPDPIDITLNYTFKLYLDEHIKEKAFLINPYFDNPETYFAYEVDDITEEVKVLPTETKYSKHIKASEDFYGINRIELKNARYEVFSNFRTFKVAYRVLTDQTVKNQIKKQIDTMLSDKYIFAGMNRYFDDKI